MSTKLFNTHHSPIGAWASLTFGHMTSGISIDHEDPKVKDSGAFLAGIVANGNLSSICFTKDDTLRKDYGGVPSSEICRTLTASKDIYSHRNFSLTVYTPYPSLPDPDTSVIRDQDCPPGILMDLTVDNTDGSDELTAFLGFALTDAKRAYATTGDGLHILRHKNDWEFTCVQIPDSYMVRGLDALTQLRKGGQIVQQNGAAFFCLTVPPGERRTLSVSWCVYTQSGSNGELLTDYYYSHLFKDLREVSTKFHTLSEYLRGKADELDHLYEKSTADISCKEFFYQALRAYYASSQLLIDSEDRIHWSLSEGGYLWRNTMDLCADHIAFELRHNPWVVRSLMDDFLTHYTYRDEVTFAAYPGVYPGGISFTHDMGCYYTYSEKGHSAYERKNDSADGFYFYMTTEELLNGIYCICSYVLSTGDVTWLSKYPSLLADLMESLENRDAPNDADRNGILKAQTLRGGACNLESTTYDALDHSLQSASGNIYVYIKTWCALVLLEKCADLLKKDDIAARARRMHERCISSASFFESADHPWLKANAYSDIPGAVCAAAEPLAIPYALGILDLAKEPELFDLMHKHLSACLQTGVCIDSVSGGLRLSSTSTNTWPSKSALTVYVAIKALNMPLPRSVIDEMIGWTTESASACTVSDQINCETREVIGAPYYPRIVTGILLLEPFD